MTARKGELMMLSHEPRPGYRTALITAIIAGWLYLLLVFLGVFSHG